MNRSRSRLLVLVVSMLAVLGVVAPASAATDPWCGITWGSLPERGGGEPLTPAVMTDVRAGRHACFDRVVVDLAGVDQFDSWSVRYVDRVLDVSGERVVPLRGGARLAVDLWAHGEHFPWPSSEMVAVTGFPTLRQVAWGGSFEGQTIVGVGVRAHLPFRVFVLEGAAGADPGMRLVIDVAHRW